MRTAFNDFFYEKRGIYGVLHVMILLLSLFLIVDISIDTFNNIPFISQTSYLKTQFWICMFFIADFILEFFLSKDKIHYLQTISSSCWFRSLILILSITTISPSRPK